MYRGDVDDPAPQPLRIQFAHHAAAHQEWPIKVGSDDAVELGKRHIDQNYTAHVEPCGINEQSRGAEDTLRRLKQMFDRGLVADICLQ